MYRALISLILLCLISTVALAEIAPARQSELLHMLKHDCGSCHGLNMTGGLGLALTPESLAGKPTTLLLNTILDGRPGTPMPPWRNILTEDEVVWLLDILKKGAVDESSQ